MVNQEKAVGLVIDNGSRALRAGFAGDEQPQFIYPAVDYSQVCKCLINFHLQIFTQFWKIKEKVAQSNRFDIKYPVENGIITNWDDMEKIWHHIFNNELHVDPSKHSVSSPNRLSIQNLTEKKWLRYIIQILINCNY